MNMLRGGVGARLGLGFSILVLFLIVGTAVGVWGVNQVSKITAAELERGARIMTLVSQELASVLGMRGYEKDMILGFDSQERYTDAYNKWQAEREQFQARIIELEKAVTEKQERSIIDMMKTEIIPYDASITKIFGLLKEGKITSPKEASEIVAKGPIGKLERGVRDLADRGNKRLASIEGTVAGSGRNISYTLLVLASLAIVVGIVLSIVITKSITRPLNTVTAGLIGASNQVTSASAQVSSSSQILAEGASEQASSLEETSSSLEEMSSMTRQNADNASQAKAMMLDARQTVEATHQHMSDMAEAIMEITKSSEETEKIVKTIDEIAFQTNLLALNAAVEAARAGEAGAGFAVVADEVRNLAMRSAEAAKTTSSLIENTIKTVRIGNDLTMSTQKKFQENMEITEKIGHLVDEIAAASDEQSQGIAQVNRAVLEMDKVTQQTASTAEESASAAEEMNAQARAVKDYVHDLAAVIGGKSKGLQLSTTQGLSTAKPLKIRRRAHTPQLVAESFSGGLQ